MEGSAPRNTHNSGGGEQHGGVMNSVVNSLPIPVAASWASTSPIAEAAIARDIEEEEEGHDDHPDHVDGEARGDHENGDDTFSPDFNALERRGSNRATHSMVGSFRRTSYIASGVRSTVLSGQNYGDAPYLTDGEQQAVLGEERSLLRDNEIIPPKHPRRGSRSSSMSNYMGGLRKTLSIQALRRTASRTRDEEAVEDEAVVGEADESTALLGDAALPYGGQGGDEDVDAKWDEAVMEGKIKTSWAREAKVLARYSLPLIVTFLLQYSLTVASIFTVGRIGPTELGAVSLASMTANITGYAIFYGLVTSLDTLCGQAYGSGHRKLVGLQTQRMVWFLWCITIPIAIVWFNGARILKAIVPEKETAELSGLYLKVLIPGIPCFALFLAMSRYVQSQGLFRANLYVLLFCAPFNAFLNWFLVWKLEMGFIGAPTAVVTTQFLMPIGLFLYIYFVAGRECWGGFDKRSLHNWVPMIRLAIPGLIMMLAEWFAFEVLTMSSSFISGEHLAAQACLGSITGVTFQVPLALSIAASTRVANFIGATLVDAAKFAAKISFVFSFAVGLLNMVLLAVFRKHIPRLYTDDDTVAEITASLLPLCAAFQLFDSLAAYANGILRGLGRQEIGGYVNLFAYYVIALPISFATGFGLGWGLYGLWIGPAIGLAIVSVIEGLFIAKSNWGVAVEAAQKRNAAA